MKLPTLFLALVCAALGCVEPPPVEGARCPCAPGFICDPAYRCVRPPVAPPRTAAPSPTAIADTARCVDPGPAPRRRLTGDEYRATVRDLVGVTVRPEDLPMEWSGPSGFRSGVDEERGDPVKWAEAHRILARTISLQAVGTLERLLVCDTGTRGVEACGGELIERFGRRALRRPVEPEEQTAYFELFRAGLSQGGYSEGVRRVVEALLASPSFTHRVERGGAEVGAAVVALTPWEVASRLSYLLWGSMPDEDLFLAAEQGRLGTAAEVRVQAERLLASPRAQDALDSFHRQLLFRSRISLEDKSSPPFTAELRRSAERGAAAFISTMVWERDADQLTLFTFPSLFADAPLARFYDLEAPASAFEAVTPSGAQRRFGWLTQPTWLAAMGHDEQSSPVRRGLVVVERLLCSDLPAPPDEVPTIDLPSASAVTTRELHAMHIQNPACSGCHRLFDPIGFGLENFDGYGRYRSHEAGVRVDASGSIRGTPFDGPGALAEYLGSSADVARCFARQWFRYAFGRRETDVDACTLEALDAAYARGGRRTKALLLGLVGSDAFSTKRR